MFDSYHPQISLKRFKSYDWFDFYRDAKEAVPGNMPESRGLPMSSLSFVDTNLADDKSNMRGQTGVTIFCNNAPIHWYGKRQPSVEATTFGAEFRAVKTAVKLAEVLWYKLRMFGVPIDRQTSVFCDNEAVYRSTVLLESTLNKKYYSVAYYRCRESVTAQTIRVAKKGILKNLVDLFTKIMSTTRRNFLIGKFTY